MGVAVSGVMVVEGFVGGETHAWVVAMPVDCRVDSAGGAGSLETSDDALHPARNKARRQKPEKTRLILPVCLIITQEGRDGGAGSTPLFQTQQALAGLHQGFVVFGKAHPHEIAHWLVEEAGTRNASHADLFGHPTAELHIILVTE